jgi:hypothetical protein
LHRNPFVAQGFSGVEAINVWQLPEPPLSESETRDMSKKQLLILALVASVPAAGLMVKLLLSLLHLLSDQSSASFVLWVVYVVCLLGSAFIAFLPLLLWLYYPAEGFAGSSAAVSAVQDSEAAFGEAPPIVGDDEVAADEEEFVEDDDSQHEGEALFDEDAMEEDFDEFDGGFDIEDDDDK